MHLASGPIAKLHTALNADQQAQYALPMGDQVIDLMPYIGQFLRLEHLGDIQCVGCGRAIRKSFQQGYCFPCTQRLAQCDLCIVKPERCHYHLGTCREPEWGEQHCMQAHYVYLANSSGLKVGITRAQNIPHRWIDQGATSALCIAQVSQRRIAGLLEVEIAQHVADKTNWRKMLQGDPEPIDLADWRDRLWDQVQSVVQSLQTDFGAESIRFLADQAPVDIQYPVLHYPTKISSHNLLKNPVVTGQLQAIKGQYLLLDTGVLNVRKFAGFHLKIAANA